MVNTGTCEAEPYTPADPVLSSEIVLFVVKSPPPVSPVPVVRVKELDTFPLRSETRFVTCDSAICIDVLLVEVTLP